jgi:predicted transcriptional regulator YdeE
MNPATGKIAGLWQKFDDKVDVNYRNGHRVYGVYFNYKSEASGEFTVLAGTDQLGADSDESLETVVILSGKYLGGEVWEYFSQENTEYKCSYLTDFEHYINQNEIKVYIAVVPM